MQTRSARRRAVQLSLLLLVAPLVGSAFFDSAKASTVSISDASADNGPGFDPQGDIVALSVTYEVAEVVMEVSNSAFADPARSESWVTWGSGVVFDVDTDGDHTADYMVSFLGSGFGPYALVVTAGGVVVCGAEQSWDASSASYGVMVEPSCFGNPSSVAVRAAFQYLTATTESFDATSFTPPVSPTPPPTTTSPTLPETTTTVPATTTTVPATTTTIPATTTTVPALCKPGFGWGDQNHVHCDRPLQARPGR